MMLLLSFPLYAFRLCHGVAIIIFLCVCLGFVMMLLLSFPLYAFRLCHGVAIIIFLCVCLGFVVVLLLLLSFSFVCA